ncbi:hypothetical protein BV898_09910 [Hypsibius exemplaris]|nr:hypothetical protein BV898_09910 [Hypsibius exemplaris]
MTAFNRIKQKDTEMASALSAEREGRTLAEAALSGDMKTIMSAISEMQAGFDAKFVSQDAEIARLNAELASQKAAFDAKFASQKAAFDAKFASQNAEIARLKSDFGDEIAGLNAEIAAKFIRMKKAKLRNGGNLLMRSLPPAFLN